MVTVTSAFGNEETLSDDVQARRFVEAALAGDAASVEQLLAMNIQRLKRIIALRISPNICRRVDEDDVLQEVLLQASQHLADFLKCGDIPFFVWLRGLTLNVLQEVHRRHLDTQMRDARREVPIASSLDATSQVLAWQFVDSGTSPSDAAQREEWTRQLREIMDCLPAADKEILALRHFEQLTPAEIAQVLQISDKASGMRYLRALKKLRDELARAPGGLSQWTLKP